MSSTFLIKDFFKDLTDFITRIEINRIICKLPLSIINNQNEDDIAQWIKNNPRKKFEVEPAYFINGQNNPSFDKPHLEKEILKNELNTLITMLSTKVDKLTESRIDIFGLNFVFKESLKIIEEVILKLTYDEWIKNALQPDKGDVFVILIEKERIPFSSMKLDQKKIKLQIDQELDFRKTLLEELKFAIVNLYSENIIFLSSSDYPKIELNCSVLEFCELLYCIRTSGIIKNSDDFEKLLLTVLDIGKTAYSKMRYDIKTRSVKNKFIHTLSENFDDYFLKQ